MNQHKINQLKDLEAEVTKFVLEHNQPEYRLPCNHHVLWTAQNVDSKIMVSQMAPDRTELYWALTDNVHDDHVLYNPSGFTFRRTAHRAGFDTKHDFFYCNIIPFFHVAGIRYTQDVIKDLIWIYDRLLEIIEPKMIITLGQDAFNATIGQQVDIMDFEDYVEDAMIFKHGDRLVCPLEDPADIINDTSNKRRPFYGTIRRLYIKSHNIRNSTNE